MKIEELKSSIVLMEKLILEYGKLYSDYCHQLCGKVSIDISNETFSCRIKPCSGGIGIKVTLPLSLLKDDSELPNIVEKDKEFYRKNQEINTCKSCGQNLFFKRG